MMDKLKSKKSKVFTKKSSLTCLFPDMGCCVITRGRQALELRSNLSERRSLTDPIQNPDQCSSSYSLRNLQWAVAHGMFFYDYS